MALKESNKNRKKKVQAAPVVNTTPVVTTKFNDFKFFTIGALIALVVFLII